MRKIRLTLTENDLLTLRTVINYYENQDQVKDWNEGNELNSLAEYLGEMLDKCELKKEIIE